MTDVKRLLDEATPLPWAVHDGAILTMRPDDSREIEHDNDLALIVHAVNHLPAYEAAVDALEWFVQFHSGHVLPPELTNAMRDAGAALRRLRGGE